MNELSKVGVQKDMDDTVTLDLSAQAHLANADERLKQLIYEVLKQITKEQSKEEKHTGGIVVLGAFVKCNYNVPGLRQIRDNPIAGELLYVTEDNIKDKLRELFKNDGAVIIDQSGQLLAARVYLQVDHADIKVDDECSTRHISAASFSNRDDIVASFTLSEQTGKVRVYVKGQQEDVFNPKQKRETTSVERPK
jgi:DNA integrity scanning protein DisA with diadenylate cyclase activity